MKYTGGIKLLRKQVYGISLLRSDNCALYLFSMNSDKSATFFEHHGVAVSSSQQMKTVVNFKVSHNYNDRYS